MHLINPLPFPSLIFQGFDAQQRLCEILVVRGTFHLSKDGLLKPAAEQSPLVETDEYFGEMHRSSLRQESDLVPFKPRCDVIVNGTGFAPEGKPTVSFTVGVEITAAPAEGEESGPLLLHKELLITAPRRWEKNRLGQWRLSAPLASVTRLPLRYEAAYGGDCRIAADDPDGRRIKPEQRLTQEQRNAHPDGPDGAPLAQAACESNPLGQGFAPPWYLQAKAVTTLTAPQIDDPRSPLTAFGQEAPPQGFGLIARTWQPRLRHAGTYAPDWFEERWPDLPEDFDPAFWNGAHPDLQMPYLSGEEHIRLTRLTPDGSLRFRLPGTLPPVQIVREDGGRGSEALRLDTLIIEPDEDRVVIVWRAAIPTLPEILQLETLMPEWAENL